MNNGNLLSSVFTYVALVNNYPTTYASTILGNSSMNDGIQFCDTALNKQNMALIGVSNILQDSNYKVIVVNYNSSGAFRWFNTGILSNSGTNLQTLNQTGVLIGKKIYNGTVQYDQPFNGLMNEVRLSNIVRSDAWIKAESLGLKNSLVTMGGV